MKTKAIGTLLLISWLLCGCSIDMIFDDWRAAVVAVLALIVAIACAAALGSNYE